MEDKRLLGTTIFAVINIFSGIGYALGGLGKLYIFSSIKNQDPLKFYAVLENNSKSPIELFSLLALSAFIGVLLIISGMYLFKLREWARRLSIIVWVSLLGFAILVFLLNPNRVITPASLCSALGGLACTLMLIFYFVHPKVKEQFK